MPTGPVQDSRSSAFALLTDTQRPLRIGKQSKGVATVTRRPARSGVAYR